MNKINLLNNFDDELLDKLFGFCYTRTKDSHEAGELCSDIVFELVKASGTQGDIENLYAFVWRIARNVYADFSKKRKKCSENVYKGDNEEILSRVADDEHTDCDAELLTSVYRRIAFLTSAYREVMIMYYLDGLSTREIAEIQKISETAVRQRLFSARQKIKSEVDEMSETYNKPVSLDKIDFVIWGTGSPAWGDPRNVCSRWFSKHIVWLCHKKPMSASEIADELNVPTMYVEEELEILRKGENGKYGLIRRLDNGKYAINFVLFDKNVFEQANALYTEQLPMICEVIIKYINDHKDEYLSFPYLNKKIDMNLILWQQITNICWAFSDNVERELEENHFSEVKRVKHPFSVFGYVDNGKRYGGGWDGINAENICGYSQVHLDNIYISRIMQHFSCGHNISLDSEIQLAIRAIEGIEISSLSESEKEHAAKATKCGYLYRDGDMLYTKILVNDLSDKDNLFRISNALQNGYFHKDAKIVAEKLAVLIKRSIPDYLWGEWSFANSLASLPILDAVVEYLIEKGVMIPPKDRLGAEGCWMSVKK